MPNMRNCLLRPILPSLVAGPTFAAPIDGSSATNAGALLVVFGVFAILIGVRDLRALRHKQTLVKPTQDATAGDRAAPPRNRR